MLIRRRPPVTIPSLAWQGSQLDGASPANILEAIVWHKEKEVEQMRQRLSLAELQQHIQQAPPPQDFLGALRRSPHPVAIIAEVKKASPSKGILRPDFDPLAIAQAYAAAGASCLSVLTDEKFFQGSGAYLQQIRAQVKLPILCKEFILDPYQILWARSLGADAILLIAAILTDDDLRYFLKLTQHLGMTALVEVHNQTELERVLHLPGINLIGINNRDLTTFQVDLETTQRLIGQIQDQSLTVVSESGIFSPAHLQALQAWGIRAALVGEALVKAPDPGAALRQLLEVSP